MIQLAHYCRKVHARIAQTCRRCSYILVVIGVGVKRERVRGKVERGADGEVVFTSIVVLVMIGRSSATDD